MADRTAARAFGEIFLHLAENPDDRNKELARWLWHGPRMHCDFAWQQAFDVETLDALGLRDLVEEDEE